MRNRQPSPEHRAQQQLRDLRREVLNSPKAVGKSYPNPDKTARILTGHQQRVRQIIRQGRQQPRLSSRWAGRQSAGDLPLVINLLWSLVMIAIVILVSWLTGWEAWPIALPLAVWVVVRSFVWTVGVPYLLFVVCLLFAALVEMHI
jgi:hypothetical protein